MKSLGILTGFVLAYPMAALAMVIWWEATLAVLVVALGLAAAVKWSEKRAA